MNHCVCGQNIQIGLDCLVPLGLLPSLPTCYSEAESSYRTDRNPWQGQCNSLFANCSHIELKDGLSCREFWMHKLAERACVEVHEMKRLMGRIRPGKHYYGGKGCWSWPLPSFYAASELNAGLAQISR